MCYFVAVPPYFIGSNAQFTCEQPPQNADVTWLMDGLQIIGIDYKIDHQGTLRINVTTDLNGTIFQCVDTRSSWKAREIVVTVEG